MIYAIRLSWGNRIRIAKLIYTIRNCVNSEEEKKTDDTISIL
jgi:hypothetical protein